MSEFCSWCGVIPEGKHREDCLQFPEATLNPPPDRRLYDKMYEENRRLRALVERGSKLHLNHTMLEEFRLYKDCKEEVAKWEKK